MIIEQLRNLLFLGLLVLILVGINRFYPNNPICPDDFENTKKRTVEFQKWIDNFYENNPNTSSNEAMESRRNFLARNNCKKALKIYNFYITANGKVVEEITGAEGAIRAKMLEAQASPICPDDFKDSESEIASFTEWANEFWEDNPDATISDFSQARVNFWRENHCTEALKRYDDFMAGNVDKETQQLIEKAIKEEMTTNKSQ